MYEASFGGPTKSASPADDDDSSSRKTDSGYEFPEVEEDGDEMGNSGEAGTVGEGIPELTIDRGKEDDDAEADEEAAKAAAAAAELCCTASDSRRACCCR